MCFRIKSSFFRYSPIYDIKTIRCNRYCQGIYCLYAFCRVEFCLSDCLYSPVTLFQSFLFFFLFITACWISLLSSMTRYFYNSSCSKSSITVFWSSSTDVAPVNFPLVEVALAVTLSSSLFVVNLQDHYHFLQTT